MSDDPVYDYFKTILPEGFFIADLNSLEVTLGLGVEFTWGEIYSPIEGTGRVFIVSAMAEAGIPSYENEFVIGYGSNSDYGGFATQVEGSVILGLGAGFPFIGGSSFPPSVFIDKGTAIYGIAGTDLGVSIEFGYTWILSPRRTEFADNDAFVIGGGDPFFDYLQNNPSGFISEFTGLNPDGSAPLNYFPSGYYNEFTGLNPDGSPQNPPLGYFNEFDVLNPDGSAPFFGAPGWNYSPDDINVFGDPVIDDFGQIIDPGIPGLSFDYSSPFSGEDLAIDHGVPGVSLDYSSPFAGPGISDDFWGDMEAFGFLPSDVVDVGDGSLDSFTSWDQFVNGGVSDSVFDFDYTGQDYFGSLYEDNFGPGLVADYSGNFNDAFSTIGPYAPVNEYFAPPQVITTTTTRLVPVTTETPTPQGAADFYFNNVVSDAALDPKHTTMKSIPNTILLMRNKTKFCHKHSPCYYH